ncbi:CHASE domain-containing protein [Acinetobacter nosocomialis]|uniref:CHASE domain-containing protein n=1 Tax=Acinetobacter calcoaceticus/baumannii complex TaxID=909768 RepID=UPI0021BE7C8C|nr:MULTISPECIES: CHASE domain-containing protein [Acinetobacter calcoaceticus/baumannii complex]EKT9294213.1 CHASE domain-containing protein [Acinetobacter baumannii]EKV7455399.1 CHASE domain-containing protein [Acinetobacter baumannii]EKW1355401.1 CHASE domain-containing protein [Acinetobacter baumannii]MCT9284044.1 CHASE domain-containing protein [Acinetobacter baumannii]MCU4554538.1 CHASE domain-containing protein [Acinetobacter nosocomialis]
MVAGSNNLTERWIELFIFIFIFLISSFFLFITIKNNISQDKQQQQSELRQTSVMINGQLRRLLDSYRVENESLVAFVQANSHLTNESFERYVMASDPFYRLPGLRSVGYLPRVATSSLAEFEAQMRQEFSNYRVWEIEKNQASYIYPLAYAVNPQEPERIKMLRGLNYASIKERMTAIQEATYSGESRTTILHPVAHDSTGKRVVLLFTPVYGGNTHASLPNERLLGFIFSVVNVDVLFTNFRVC